MEAAEVPEGAEVAGTDGVDVGSEAVAGVEGAGASAEGEGDAAAAVGVETLSGTGDGTEGLPVTGELEAAAPTPDVGEEAEVNGVVVPVAGVDDAGVEVAAVGPSAEGVLVAEAGVGVDVATEAAAGMELGETTEMTGAELSGDEVATTKAMFWVVPSETVSCSSGLAKECQSNVVSVAVADARVKLKPVASFSWMNAAAA